MKEKNLERKRLEARRCTENLRKLLTGYKSLLEHHLRAEGATLPQLRLLKAVQQQSGESAAALARTCMVTPQTMQSILTRAVREGWIIRQRSSHNDRILTASLTPLGEEVLERGVQLAARIDQQIWQAVSLSDLKVLNETLEQGVGRLTELEQKASESLSPETLTHSHPESTNACLTCTPDKPKRG